METPSPPKTGKKAEGDKVRDELFQADVKPKCQGTEVVRAITDGWSITRKGSHGDREPDRSKGARVPGSPMP